MPAAWCGTPSPWMHHARMSSQCARACLRKAPNALGTTVNSTLNGMHAISMLGASTSAGCHACAVHVSKTTPAHL